MSEGIVLSMVITSHIGWTGNFNDVHPTIAYERNGYSVGLFRNSLNHTSLFVSKTDKFDGFSVEYGLANNYEGKVVPMLILRKKLVDNINLMVVPSYNKTTKQPATVLGVEFRY